MPPGVCRNTSLGLFPTPFNGVTIIRGNLSMRQSLFPQGIEAGTFDGLKASAGGSVDMSEVTVAPRIAPALRFWLTALQSQVLAKPLPQSTFSGLLVDGNFNFEAVALMAKPETSCDQCEATEPGGRVFHGLLVGGALSLHGTYWGTTICPDFFTGLALYGQGNASLLDLRSMGIVNLCQNNKEDLGPFDGIAMDEGGTLVLANNNISTIRNNTLTGDFTTVDLHNNSIDYYYEVASHPAPPATGLR